MGAVADDGGAEAWAAWLRDTRAAVLSGLSEGRCDLGGVLAAREEAGVAPIHLLAVLEALPGAGKVSTRRRLRDLGMAERTELGGLDASGVAALLDAFGDRIGSR